MARNRQIIETVVCDLCGNEAEDAATVTLGWGNDRWELDLCGRDLDRVSAEFDAWVDKGRRARGGRSGGSASTRRSSRSTSDDWDYLESLGFKRHRGRKSAEEAAALANRK